ncbi:MAG: DNA gyrase inhibitor YacG [Pseudomonadota bacterium]
MKDDAFAPPPEPAPRGRCPICEKAPDPEYRPFCSRRCADVDLGRWMTGGYAAPAEEADDPDAEDASAARRIEGRD